MSSKQEQLDQIEADIITNNACGHLAKGAKHLVMGEGSLDANVVFIGEAPGAKEDELGRPFVGAAGKFLDEMLADVGMKREEVYITNIVKYRPPGNRDPEPEEKNIFLPYLMRQLKLIKPKLIVTLGRHSTEVFLPSLRISQVHGQPKRIKIVLNREESSQPRSRDIRTGDQVATKLDRVSDFVREQVELSLVILPLYHPAAALYNANMRETLIKDFHNIPKILEQVNYAKKETQK